MWISSFLVPGANLPPLFHLRCSCIAYLPDSRQSDGVLMNIQSRFQALLPMLTSTSRTERSSLPDPHAYPTGSARDGNARFARAPSSSTVARNRGGAPPAVSSPREPPQRRDSVLTASEASFVSTASPSAGQHDHTAQPQGTHAESSLDGPYRRPGKHRVGESPTPEEYMALPPEAKKKVDNRLSARRSRAKRKGN